MRHETAISAAFKRADATVSHMEAYTLAAKLLREAGGDRAAAPPAALKKFLAAIQDDMDLLRGCALGFLQFVARDMKGDVNGQSLVDAQSSNAKAPPSDRDGSAPFLRATHTRPVAPVREPSSAQKQAAGLARLKTAESVLMSFKVRDGRAIAKVWRSEISDLIGENWRENAILDRVRKIPLPNGANDAQIGTYISDVQMRRIISEVDGALAA